MIDPLEITSYQNLAAAIILTAAQDYRAGLIKNNQILKNECKLFFYSEWFALLSDLDPGSVLSRIEKSHKKKNHVFQFS